MYISYHVIRGESGRYPLYNSGYKLCLKYWYKLLPMSCTRLPKKFNTVLMLDMKFGKCNLGIKIEMCVFQIGAWLLESVRHAFPTQFIDRAKCICD